MLRKTLGAWTGFSFLGLNPFKSSKPDKISGKMSHKMDKNVSLNKRKLQLHGIHIEKIHDSMNVMMNRLKDIEKKN